MDNQSIIITCFGITRIRLQWLQCGWSHGSQIPNFSWIDQRWILISLQL